MKSIFEKVGPEIRAQRKFLGLSRGALGNLAGFDATTIRNYEQGKGMTVAKLMTLVDAMGLSMTDFFELVEGYKEHDAADLRTKCAKLQIEAAVAEKRMTADAETIKKQKNKITVLMRKLNSAADDEVA